MANLPGVVVEGARQQQAQRSKLILRVYFKINKDKEEREKRSKNKFLLHTYSYWKTRLGLAL